MKKKTFYLLLQTLTLVVEMATLSDNNQTVFFFIRQKILGLLHKFLMIVYVQWTIKYLLFITAFLYNLKFCMASKSRQKLFQIGEEKI